MFKNYNASSFATAASQTTYDAGLRSYMAKVYNMMAVSLGISGVVAFVISNSPALLNAIFGSGLAIIFMFAPLALVFYLSARINSMSAQKAKTFLFIYSAVMGISLSTIFLAYTSASVTRVFFITASVFGAMGIYGNTTKKDLTGMGSFLFMGLIGIVIASIVNIFLQSSAMQFSISVIGVLVFTGLTAYDTQRIKHTYYQLGGNSEIASKAAVMGALSLYLDFINLFISLLHILGDRR